MQPPFSYQFMNTVEGTIHPSFLHIHNTSLSRFFKQYLLQDVLSVFKFTLPDWWDADYFRYSLLGYGYVAIFKTDKFGVIPQQCNLTGYNVFYRPTKAMIANPLIGGRELDIGRNCEILKVMPDYSGIANIVDYYGDLMALTWEGITTNILNSKLAYIGFAGNKAQLFQVVCFEDSRSGDYDYNDLVIHVKYQWNGTRFGFGVHPIALGSTKEVRLGAVVYKGSTRIFKGLLAPGNADARTQYFQSQAGFINTGTDRQILSGIAKWFKPEDLIGKKLGIVCNLAPRPMMKGKYTSEGMIVAADTADGGCEIAFYSDNVPTGTRVH